MLKPLSDVRWQKYLLFCVSSLIPFIIKIRRLCQIVLGVASYWHFFSVSPSHTFVNGPKMEPAANSQVFGASIGDGMTLVALMSTGFTKDLMLYIPRQLVIGAV